MRDIYLWHGATGASDGSDFPNSYTTQQAAYNAWQPGDTIKRASDHAETVSYLQCYTAGQADQPIEIINVNRMTGAIEAATSPNITSASGSGLNITQFNVDEYGGYYRTPFDMMIGLYNGHTRLRDTFLESVSGYQGMPMSISGETIELENTRVKLSNGGGCVRFNGRIITVDGLTITGRVDASNAAIELNPGVFAAAQMYGVDGSGTTSNGLGMFGWSNATSAMLIADGVTLRAGQALMATAPNNDGKRAVFSNLDLADGNGPRDHVVDYRGVMSSDFATYRTTGYAHPVSTKHLAWNLQANSLTRRHRPLRGKPMLFYCPLASAVTFSFEALENYTTQLTTADLYLVIETPSSVSGVQRNIVRAAYNTPIALPAGAGAGAWTVPPVGARSVLVTATVVLPQPGVCKITPVLARYEAGKSVWFCPKRVV